MKKKQQIIILDGPDMTGKTQIGKELSKRLKIPYFKNENEGRAFKYDIERYFITMLRYSDPFFVSYLKQTGASVILDRSYPSEYVYSKVFRRATDIECLKKLDANYAELGAKIIICCRESYLKKDDLCPEKINLRHYFHMHNRYELFAKEFTKCDVKFLSVDDEDLKREVNEIIKFIKQPQVAVT